MLKLKIVVDTDVIGTIPTSKCENLFQYYMEMGWINNKHLDKIFPRNAKGKPILRWETLRGFLKSICPNVDYSKIYIDNGYVEIPKTVTYVRLIDKKEKQTLMNIEIIPAGTELIVELRGDEGELMKIASTVDGKSGYLGSRGKYGYGHVHVFVLR